MLCPRRTAGSLGVQIHPLNGPKKLKSSIGIFLIKKATFKPVSVRACRSLLNIFAKFNTSKCEPVQLASTTFNYSKPFGFTQLRMLFDTLILVLMRFALMFIFLGFCFISLNCFFLYCVSNLSILILPLSPLLSP